MEPVLSPVVHGKHVMCFTGWQLDRVNFSRNPWLFSIVQSADCSFTNVNRVRQQLATWHAHAADKNACFYRTESQFGTKIINYQHTRAQRHRETDKDRQMQRDKQADIPWHQNSVHMHTHNTKYYSIMRIFTISTQHATTDVTSFQQLIKPIYHNNIV